MLNIDAIRSRFPILRSTVHGKPLIYLDNAATTQKPVEVLEASRQYYETVNSNIHRGAHYLSQLATEAHEEARKTVAEFLHAPDADSVLFTSGCTMSINMAAEILGLSGRIRQGDEIVISTDSHHANIVPWQMLCQRTGAVLRVVPLTEGLRFDMEAYARMLSPRTRIVSVPYISNALGLVLPVREIARMAHEQHADTLVLIDGAQSTGHMEVDVAELGCDFYAFSGHKVYAPTGIGVLWGREDLLRELPPWLGGGEMIREVTFEKTTYNDLPFKYEAGTPNIEGAIALAAALRFVRFVGMDGIESHEARLTRRLLEGLRSMGGMRVLGGDEDRGSLVSVVVPGVHHYDLGTLLDQMGIAVRTGHHCGQPLMQALGITGTTRFSFAMYNSVQEVETTLGAVERALNMLR